ncbi:MAG: Fic family protein [Candidatus Gracilibacteria bacterium]
MPKKRIGETSYKDTAFGILPRSELIPLEIEGIKRAWDAVIQKFKHGDIPLTVSFVKEVHKVGFGWIFPKLGGKFRTLEVTVSKHEPPKYYLVSQFMEDFMMDLKTRLKHAPKIDDTNFIDWLTELLAWAHHRFLWIHPFQDYNGRISRLLINIILIKLDLPPIELKVETPTGRKKYVRSLQQADHGDHTGLELLIRAAIDETARELSR